MEKSFYIDSNIFIFAYSDDKDNGVSSRKLLEMLVNNKISAYTSVLTFDEVFYKIKQLKDREMALIVAQSILNLRNLRFVAVNLDILNWSYSLLKNYTSLNPRDSIHLACALSCNIKNFISNDHDFNAIKEVKRIDINDFAN